MMFHNTRQYDITQKGMKGLRVCCSLLQVTSNIFCLLHALSCKQISYKIEMANNCSCNSQMYQVAKSV